MILELFSLIIIAINTIVYFLPRFFSFGGGFTNSIEYFIDIFAKNNEAIASGQYYRLITSMFLHGNILHLFVNMYSLIVLAPIVSRLYGSYGLLTIYFVSGVAGSLFSYFLTPAVSIGASGAIFGLVGALLAFSIQTKSKKMFKSIGYVVGINLFIGIVGTGIDNWAHIGGMLAGLLLGYFLPKQVKIFKIN